MKILDLKKLKLLYVNLIAIVVLLPSFGGAGGGLYAQSGDLLGESWTFIEGNINGVVLQSPANFGGVFTNNYFGDSYFVFDYGTSTYQCDEWHITYFDVSNNEFYLDEIIDIQTNTCQGPDVLDFIDKHNSFFVHLPLDTNGAPKNPFSYTIVNMGSQNQLTITNNEGDWAKYGGGMLSNQTFHQSSFTLYPNPVKEVLYVNNILKQEVMASVYDISGKLLQSHSIETSLSTINLQELNSGLYFVVFKSKTGERVSKKFVKN
ncbi:MAG: T9SS type A sorting domain-containing protein [Flavobacteriales bacterium]|nr:T9SS type A sorting domain-containing protein [Flavobacteriales bacterium]